MDIKQNSHSQRSVISRESIHRDAHLADGRHLGRAACCSGQSCPEDIPTNWNPGGLKELTPPANCLSLSHRGTCPLGGPGSRRGPRCQKVKANTSPPLCTWIPWGEGSEGRNVSFSVSKSESHQVRLQGETMIPGRNKPEEAQDLSQKSLPEEGVR